ncbi:MAG TPA: GDSL-type esterase/lipase family protein [Armatimonadota bacterium]|jgi:lysophospholipase L1-like esterase
MRQRSLFLLLLGVTLWASGMSLAVPNLVHDGDRWVCLGDSITAMNCYPPVLERVFKHYHPEANFTVINSGVGGDVASDDPQKLTNRVLKYNPTIVSIMYGMNEAINIWHLGQPKAPVQENYRKCLTYMVRTLRAKHITVLLMSPTLTDPSCHSFFVLEQTIPFLKECAQIMREVAQAEGAHYVPVQEDLEAFALAQPAGVAMTADGVHPAALGQYRMARSLWEYCGFAGPMNVTSKRKTRPTPALPVTAALASRFVQTNATGVALTLTADKPLTVTASWSIGDLHKQETLKLVAGANSWNVPVPADHLPARNGQNSSLLVDLRAGEADTLYFIDLCRTQVLHLVDNRVSGTVDSDTDGKRLATWQVQRLGESLFFNCEVIDAEINPEGFWPFGRDGLNLMFDFRPTARFADLGIDREVYQAFLNVREQPSFAVGLRAWTGQGLDFASTVGGARTPTGYTVQLFIHDNFNPLTPVKLSTRDFVGLLVAVDDLAVVNKAPKMTITTNQRNDYPVNVAANNLMILDLKNKLPGEQIINAHLFAAR